MAVSARTPRVHRVQTDRVLQEHRPDQYEARGKPKESTVCPDCGAVFRHGRWQWSPRSVGAYQAFCPACQRIHDGMPAGYVSLAGKFLDTHRAEIIQLIGSEGAQAAKGHPLARIMGIEDKGELIEVTTADIHLARRIGDAMRHAYGGDLEYHYDQEEYLLTVHWVH